VVSVVEWYRTACQKYQPPIGLPETIPASVELEVLGREKDVYILTMETECDEESDSGVSSQIRRVINKVPEELRPLWEQLEANPSDRKSTKMTVIVSYTSERIKHEERRGKQ
jgi:hypothetical protein